MAMAKFMYKNTKQIIIVEDTKKIAACKKNDKYILIEEAKATRTRKPVEQKTETEE
jgi:hypothetical protein